MKVAMLKKATVPVLRGALSFADACSVASAAREMLVKCWGDQKREDSSFCGSTGHLCES